MIISLAVVVSSEGFSCGGIVEILWTIDVTSLGSVLGHNGQFLASKVIFWKKKIILILVVDTYL